MQLFKVGKENLREGWPKLNIETEIGFTIAEYKTFTKEHLAEKNKTCTSEQITAFNKLYRDTIESEVWQQRINGTHRFDVEMREFLINEIIKQPAVGDQCVDTFGRLFEDYIVTYPVNVSMFAERKTTSLGAYGGILNFQLLERAVDEILEVAFDKFGFMLEWIQNWDYLTPTHAMISSTMRRKMPEYGGSNGN